MACLVLNTTYLHDLSNTTVRVGRLRSDLVSRTSITEHIMLAVRSIELLSDPAKRAAWYLNVCVCV